MNGPAFDTYIKTQLVPALDPGTVVILDNLSTHKSPRTVRHEWLDQNIFETIEEIQDQATKWLWTYNNDRPNMAIGGITPAMKLKMAA